MPAEPNDIDELIEDRRLERVAPNPRLAAQLLDQADAHVASARLLIDIDPPGAFGLAYDAARKALTAIVATHGYRAKGAGGHATLLYAAKALLDAERAAVVEDFDWMRRLRNSTEYPDGDKEVADRADVEEALPAAVAMIALARVSTGGTSVPGPTGGAAST